MPARDVVLALAVTAVWGLNFVAIKWSVAEVPPLLLTALRYVVAVLPAIFFIRRPTVSLVLLAGYGLAVGVGQFGLLFSAMHLGMPAGLASVVVQVQAFFSIALAMLFLGERMGPVQIAGAVIAFAGIGVIGSDRLEFAALLPLGMSLLAAVCWAFANLLTKWAGRIDMLGFVVWSSLVPPIPLLLMSLAIEGPGAIPAAAANLTWLGVLSILFIGWAATVFGYGWWSILLGRHPASTVAPFALLVPVTGLAASALLLGERISTIEAAGCLLVLAGLLLNVFGPRFLRSRPAA